MTPDTNEKHSLAGALHRATDTLLQCLGHRKKRVVSRPLDIAGPDGPISRGTRISVMVDNDGIHKQLCFIYCLANALSYSKNSAS
jgi:hypothetical protein